MDIRKIFFRVATIILVVVTLFLTGYIIVNRLGLFDDYDFGAGAYYYADIPGFDKILKEDSYNSELPTWVAILLFLGWGFLMYRFWVWVDKRSTARKEKNNTDSKDGK